jgi:hypothetical protein
MRKTSYAATFVAVLIILVIVSHVHISFFFCRVTQGFFRTFHLRISRTGSPYTILPSYTSLTYVLKVHC